MGYDREYVIDIGRKQAMKFLHLGDLHIGKSLSEFHLIKDQKYILEQIVDLAVERGVDGILIAGDVYDKSIPSEEAVELFDHFICRLVEKGLKTFIISGNHDSDERLNFGSSLFAAKQVYISAKYNGTLYHQELEDEQGKVQLYLLPFVKASQVRHFFPEEEIESYEDAVRVIIEKAGISPKERNILVAHQFVTGGSGDPELGGSEGMAVASLGLVEKISASVFDVFDYVALGHIHSGQKVGREEVRYSGSPLKYSLSEVSHRKSVPLVTLGKKGEVEIELVELKPMRDLRHLKGKLDQLTSKEHVKDTEDFIYVTLTGDFQPNAMGIIQQFYPNTVKLDYENAQIRDLQQVDFEQIGADKSFGELIGEFYQLVYDREMTEDEIRIMEEVAKDAGIQDK